MTSDHIHLLNFFNMDYFVGYEQSNWRDHKFKHHLARLDKQAAIYYQQIKDNGNFILLEEYQGALKSIKHFCKKHNKVYKSAPNGVKQKNMIRKLRNLKN